MKVKITMILIMNICFGLLSGCWDKLELEEQAYVVTVGIDIAEGDNIVVTCQIANPQGGSTAGSGGNQNEPAAEIVSFTMRDFLSIRDLAASSVTRRITFTHTKTLVVGEDFARSDKFYNILESIVRDRQVRRDTYLIISKESAEDFIRNNQSALETRPHKFYEFMSKRWQESGLVPVSIIRRFIHDTESGEALHLAIYGTNEKTSITGEKDEDNYIAGEVDKKGGNKVQLIGSAVFKDGKMINVIDGEDTRIALLLREQIDIDTYFVTYKDPKSEEYVITIRLTKHKKTKVDINTDNEIPTINVVVPLEASVVSIPSNVDYVTDEGNKNFLADYIGEELKKKTEKFLDRSKEEFKMGAFDWYLIARKQFNTLEEYKLYNWREKYPEAEITVEYDVSIKDFGRLFQPHTN
jgi:Ger(x)C family germination protein